MNSRVGPACLIIIQCILSIMASGQLQLTTELGKNVSETTSSKEILLKEAIDQLYKETMIRLEIEKKLRTLTEEVSNLKAGYEKVCAAIQTDKENGSQGMTISAVGFSALLSKDATLGVKQIVKYDNVITNQGNGYDKWTGIFTAPTAGLYVFSCTIMAFDRSAIHIEIVQDGRLISTVNSDISPWNQGSETVVLTLKKGGKVWTRAQHVGKIHGLYNIFSGFLTSTEI
ncbi:complement C1q subcomponent subunit B-like [Saccostrea cucullata]|uniref:complement C1q subcomponent subunit B-like n=1 Tax=Saccostrea cuccullata TaxID=36930 RepID=UPI002ED23159